MRVWEAIEMLQGMDGNKEVTVTMGKQPKNVPFTPQPAQPNWVIDHQYWPKTPWYPNTITCKTH